MIVGSRRKQRGALRTHDSAGEAFSFSFLLSVTVYVASSEIVPPAASNKEHTCSRHARLSWGHVPRASSRPWDSRETVPAREPRAGGRPSRPRFRPRPATEGGRRARGKPRGSAHSTGQSEMSPLLCTEPPASLTVSCTLPPFSSLPRRPRLDLLGQQLVRQVVSVA